VWVVKAVCYSSSHQSLFAIRYSLPFWLGRSLALPSFVDFSLPQQPFDVGYEFPDLLLVRAVVVTSDSPLTVNEDEAVAVDEISSTTFLLRRNFLCRHLKTVPSQSVNRFFVAREEEPFAVHRIKVLAILPQDFGCIVFRVNGDADDDDIWVIGEGFLNFRHVLVHDGADARTRCEEKFSHPNFALQVFQPEGFSVMSDEAEIGNAPINRQPAFVPLQKVSECCRGGNDSHQTDQATKSTDASIASVSHLRLDFGFGRRQIDFAPARKILLRSQRVIPVNRWRVARELLPKRSNESQVAWSFHARLVSDG